MYSQEPGERKVCSRLPQDENPSPWLLGSKTRAQQAGAVLGFLQGWANCSCLQEVLFGWPMPCLGFLYYIPRQGPGFGDFGPPDVYIFH